MEKEKIKKRIKELEDEQEGEWNDFGGNARYWEIVKELKKLYEKLENIKS